MKKVLISLVLAVALTLAIAAPAMAGTGPQTSPLTASVTVNSYISATITDNGNTGINFGSLNPGTSNNAEVAQGASGAITVTVGAETNQICKTGVNGVDFSDGASHTIAIGNAGWNIVNTAPGTAMTTNYAQAGSDSTPGTAQTIQIYHWLSIPNGQYAAAYTSTFTYKVDTSLP